MPVRNYPVSKHSRVFCLSCSRIGVVCKHVHHFMDPISAPCEKGSSKENVDCVEKESLHFGKFFESFEIDERSDTAHSDGGYKETENQRTHECSPPRLS